MLALGVAEACGARLRFQAIIGKADNLSIFSKLSEISPKSPKWVRGAVPCRLCVLQGLECTLRFEHQQVGSVERVLCGAFEIRAMPTVGASSVPEVRCALETFRSSS